MKKAAFLLVFALAAALPAVAQTTEFGVLFGGSNRVVRRPSWMQEELNSPGFKFSNSAVDMYYAVQLDPGLMFKAQIGRIDTPVAFEDRPHSGGTTTVFQGDGQVQHAEGVIEYRFSEPFGSTGLFAGVGMYRTTAQGHESTTDYGFPVGLTADFPLSRRFGVITGATYHIVKADLNPKYLTISAGLRLGF